MSVQDHYARAGSGRAIAARILQALGAIDVITPDALAPFDHVHGRGVLATQELAALLEPQVGEAILDIGSGIGGPARWIASKYGCNVTGVDLTAVFCEAARELNAACGLSDKVRIIEGSALALPLPDAAFDRAYSHNVVMNIADKAGAYREAFRVLKPNGRLVLCHLNAASGAPLDFPVPWASLPENSFLATDADTSRDLLAAGFEILTFRDTTKAPLPGDTATRGRESPPTSGMHMVMGENYLLARSNSQRATEDGRTRTVAIVARKPA